MVSKLCQFLIFLWKKFSRKNPLLAKIFSWVLLLHIFSIILFSFSLKSKTRLEKRMIVKNLSYSAPIQKTVQQKAPIPKVEAQVKEKKKPDKPQEKKVQPKPPSPETQKKPVPAVPKKTPPPATEEKNTSFALALLQKLDKDLTPSTNTQKEEFPSKNLTVPAPLPRLYVETNNSELPPSLEEIRYSDLLIHFLENALELPEKGEVKMRLEIDSDGKLLSLEILNAESRKNSQYLKNTLPALYFPCFNEGVSEKKRKLIIRFCSQK